MIIKKVFLSLLIVVGLVTNSLALSPVEVVQKYCVLDGQGYRAGFGDYQLIRDLMSWDEYQDEPGWDGNYIINDFKIIDSTIIDETNAKVIVEYDIIALYGADNSLKIVDKKKRFTFELLSVDNIWKIKYYVPLPRIYLSLELSSLKQLYLKLKKNEPDSEKTIKIGKFIEIYGDKESDLEK